MFRILIVVGLSGLLSVSSPFEGLFDRAACRFCWMFEAAPVVERKPKPAERSFRVLFFSAVWCGPCQSVKSDFDWLRRSGWTIGSGSSNHIQTVDVDRDPREWGRWRGRDNVVPLAVLIRDGREVRRIIPASGADLMRLHNGH